MSHTRDTELSFSLYKNSVNKVYISAYNADTDKFGRNKFSPAIFQSYQSARTSAVILNHPSV